MLKLTSVLIYQQFSGFIPATVATLSFSFNSAKYLYILLLFDYGITQAIKNPAVRLVNGNDPMLGVGLPYFLEGGIGG